MKAEGQIERLQSVPQGVVISALPLVIDQRIGAQKNGGKAELLGAAARFAHSVFHAVGRDHAGADQALWVLLTEVIHPIVVSARNCSGELSVQSIVHDRS